MTKFPTLMYGKTRREYILGLIDDELADLLYYDRKEDEDLPRGSIEEAINDGEITVDEIMHVFGRGFLNHMKAIREKSS